MVTSGLEPGGMGNLTPPSLGIVNSERWEVSVRVMVYSLCLVLGLLLAVGGLIMSLRILQNAAPLGIIGCPAGRYILSFRTVKNVGKVGMVRCFMSRESREVRLLSLS